MLHKNFYIGAVASLIALIALCVAWEMVLAPLRPGGSWLVLKVIPLLLPLRGVLKRDIYTLQWSSMLILLYFAEGRCAPQRHRRCRPGWAGAKSRWSASSSFAACSTCSPYKKAAKKLANAGHQEGIANHQ